MLEKEMYKENAIVLDIINKMIEEKKDNLLQTAILKQLLRELGTHINYSIRNFLVYLLGSENFFPLFWHKIHTNKSQRFIRNCYLSAFKIIESTQETTEFVTFRTKDFENNLMSLACNIMLFEVRKEIDKQLKNKIL
jgi:hypothetical protein